MLALLLPAAAVVLAWWGSTALLLHLDMRAQRSFPLSFGLASLLAVAAGVGIEHSSVQADVPGAYLAFACALALWGWLELGFLLGYLTGPGKRSCDPTWQGWQRFGHAFNALRDHEISLLGGALLVVALCWNAPNQVAVWTYLVLWAMRASAKLNVFLGVRNLSEDFLPPHLRYLASYFRQAPMNRLFPFTVTLAVVVDVLLFEQAVASADDAFGSTALMLVATLLLLAIVEHWCLVVPVNLSALWQWQLQPGHDEPPEETAAATAAVAPGPRLKLIQPAAAEQASPDPGSRRSGR